MPLDTKPYDESYSIIWLRGDASFSAEGERKEQGRGGGGCQVGRAQHSLSSGSPVHAQWFPSHLAWLNDAVVFRSGYKLVPLVLQRISQGWFECPTWLHPSRTLCRCTHHPMAAAGLGHPGVGALG